MTSASGKNDVDASSSMFTRAVSIYTSDRTSASSFFSFSSLASHPHGVLYPRSLASILSVSQRVVLRIQFSTGMHDGPATTTARLFGLLQQNEAEDDSLGSTHFGQLSQILCETLTPPPRVLHASSPSDTYSLDSGCAPYHGDGLFLGKHKGSCMKIEEQIAHSRGSSALGYYQVAKYVPKFAKAACPQVGKKTPACTRFSTITYDNYDLVGLNLPAFLSVISSRVQATFCTHICVHFNHNLTRPRSTSQQRNPKYFSLGNNAWPTSLLKHLILNTKSFHSSSTRLHSSDDAPYDR
ncbi:hypothetical protein NM688_g9007 [Phlebia brevispora]|uniref:Uncharacterized protein n=1 Tax=Phlebia brevispora TaxID=194682 RepID=A0ACC1RKG0_9APHY|nr:hypothetical protein NM688_g9007 [Phlebia brevispora]